MTDSQCDPRAQRLVMNTDPETIKAMTAAYNQLREAQRQYMREQEAAAMRACR